ncbi:M10 family metallopeptidase domain-containing protein [Bradyrhizobium sp. BR 1433]|uniref:M10 family metallopeptidase domain-containing protein n=1 Tax=Bradyrhizobium sp. BR 1433 TaxID=3447967 RepID=UPI003EE674B8
MLDRPRCGVPDPPYNIRYGSSGRYWDKSDLSYAFHELSHDLPQPDIRSTIINAFAAWAAVVPLRFTEVSAAAPHDIAIRFVYGDHGDGNPFDGPGRVLAHAYYPPPGNFAGDVHFDDAEVWRINPSRPSEFDLLSVAIHEIGHALGLTHSTIPNSIMYDAYNGVRQLTNDDIIAIGRLYGAVPKGSVLTGFTYIDHDANKNAIHWSPDGLFLGAGRPNYAGGSPVAGILSYQNGILTAFSNAGGNGHRIWFSAEGNHLGGGELRYDGSSPVRAMCAHGGGVLTAFSNAGGNGHRIWFSPNGLHLGGGELRYDGSSPVSAMCSYGAGVLTAFSNAGGHGHRIWFSPDGKNLGGGELRYDGSSPIEAMCEFQGGVLVAFSNAGGNGHRIWFSPNGLHLGGGELRYDGSSPVRAMCVYEKGS